MLSIVRDRREEPSSFPGQPSGLVAAAGGLGAEGPPRLAALPAGAAAGTAAVQAAVAAVLQVRGAGGGEGGVPARHGRPHELVDGVGADDAAAVARPLRRREVPARVAADRARA